MGLGRIKGKHMFADKILDEIFEMNSTVYVK